MKTLLRGSYTMKQGMIGLLLLDALFSITASAGPVQLQQGTATFSQTCCGISIPGSPAQAIDGIFSDIFGVTLNGWAVVRIVNGVEVSMAETAVWETTSDVGPGAINFKMYFLHANVGHLLGRFRFSVTTDDRSTFADGLSANGDVTANWTVLTDPTVLGPSGMTFTILSDDSVLAGGVNPGTGIYEVGYVTNLSAITGIRLEALEDPSLPMGTGPGLYSRNGNFVLTELEVNLSSIPEPATLALLALGLAGLGFSRRTRAS